ncbi:helix-turn-helix domain-containing protein [Lactiplantibacillus sp. YT640]|uniref:helix-turn-helix domain-containing protein n=1 Tax=Lactiplantibacillus sp. YT640 TaxID=3412789 RepID=UPI003C743EB1
MKVFNGVTTQSIRKKDLNRVVIETLHNEGRSLRYIANYLDFSKTTIFNELAS